MTETEKLRALLDERGVEHTDMGGMTEFIGANGRMCRCYTRPEPLTVDVAMMAVPAEQAVDATLGRGECEWTLAEQWQNSEGNDYVYGFKTGCGAQHTWWPDELPRYCPSCGARVKEAR